MKEYYWRTLKLNFGLGLISGVVECLRFGFASLLHLEFLSTLFLFAAETILHGFIGLVLGACWGTITYILPRLQYLSDRLSLGATLTGLTLAAWQLIPHMMKVYGNDQMLAFFIFCFISLLFPFVLWYNTLYWLRRTENHGKTKYSWPFVSLMFSLLGILLATGMTQFKTYSNEEVIYSDPDVILVTVDSLRSDQLNKNTMPYLDGLASSCLRYTDLISSLPTTRPSHVSIMTGIRSSSLGIFNTGKSLPPKYKTLSYLLKQQGYATAAFVSSKRILSDSGLEFSFDVYDDEFYHSLHGMSQISALGFVSQFFKQKASRGANSTLGLAQSWLNGQHDMPTFTWIHLSDPSPPFDDHPGVSVAAGKHRSYRKELAFVDQQLEAFFKNIEERTKKVEASFERERLLVIAGTRGEMLGEHELSATKRGLYEELIKTAMVICPVKHSQTNEIATSVRLIDIYNTIVTQVGLPRQPMVEGRNIVEKSSSFQTNLPAFLVGKSPSRTNSSRIYGLRIQMVNGMYKYIWNPSTKSSVLYNLTVDSQESVNISETEPSIRQALHQKLIKIVKEINTERK